MAERLHDPDCPMTNSDPAARTSCVCDQTQWADPEGHTNRTVPEGSGGRVDCRWQMVACCGCGAEYQCTPERDYFESTTLTDGLCWDCFMKSKNMPPQPEPEYR